MGEADLDTAGEGRRRCGRRGGWRGSWRPRERRSRGSRTCDEGVAVDGLDHLRLLGGGAHDDGRLGRAGKLGGGGGGAGSDRQAPWSRESSRSSARFDSDQYLPPGPTDDTDTVAAIREIAAAGSRIFERAIDPSAHVPDGARPATPLPRRRRAVTWRREGWGRASAVGFPNGVCVVAGDWAKRGHPVAAGKPREGARATRDAGTATHLRGGDARRGRR